MTGAAYPDWDAIYRDNVTWVYRLIYGKVGNQPDAEDLTAEVFMTALRPLRVSATVPEVRKYLRMTSRTVLAPTGVTGWAAITYGRRGRSGIPRRSNRSRRQRLRPRQVRRLLQRLPDNYRRILELRFLQAFSVREAAIRWVSASPNAKVLQHRALRMAAQSGEEVTS